VWDTGKADLRNRQKRNEGTSVFKQTNKKTTFKHIHPCRLGHVAQVLHNNVDIQE
jgi:hypothetical protein